MTEKKQLGRILLKQRAISPEELEKELSVGGGRLASRLAEKGTISGLAALKALSEQHGIPGIDLDQVCVKLSDLELLPREIAQRHLILPVLSRGERLFVAMANPKEKKVIDELEFVTGKRVYPYVALEKPLAATIEEAYSRKARGDDYFIGPRCPPETLEKLGLSAHQGASEEDRTEPGSSADGSSEDRPSALPPSQARAERQSEPPRLLRKDSDFSLELAERESAPPPEAARGSSEMPGRELEQSAGREPEQTAGSDPFATADATPLPPMKPRAVRTPSRAPDPRRSLTPSIYQQPSGVTLEKRPDEPDVTYEDFGDLDSELSVVMDIPDQPKASSGQVRGTILVVDDEAEIRRMLERLLSGKGYRVLQADDGAMALRMVKEHTPDMILLDAMLPSVHGFDIARRIKGSKRYGHIPIVMVSAVYRGWHYAEDLKQSCGVDAFLEKPFKIADVVLAVEEALEGKRNRPAADPEAMHQKAEEALKRGVLAYKEGRLDEAVALLKSGVEIDPLAYRLHFHLGLLYGRKGQIFDAIAALEQAVGINSRHFPAVKNLAILYQKAGFKNKAAEMWHKAAVIAPDEATRESVKKQLMILL